LDVIATELRSLYDQAMRRESHVAGCTREFANETARYTTLTGSLRYILWHEFDAERIAEIVAREMRDARDKAKVLIWKVYEHDTPCAPLRKQLIAHGFEENDPSSLMVAPAELILKNAQQHPTTLTIRELQTPESMDAYLNIWNHVWPDEPNARYVGDYRAILQRGDPNVVFFAAFAPDDEPISSGYMFHHVGARFALLCGGTTKAAWRGQRVYTSLVAQRAKCAMDRGAEFLSVEASSESLPILQKLGFVAISTLMFYETPLQEIEPARAAR
jgi:hypothetical protein